MATSFNIYLGGFKLVWDDVTPVYRINDTLTTELVESQENMQSVCAMIKVYKGTPEIYPAFITPETYFDGLQK